MADIRIKDLATTATTTASDDFMAVDGSTNGTRKMNAATPAFLTSVTTPSLTSPAATNLTLAGGSSGASLVLGQGASGNATLVSPGTFLLYNTANTTGLANFITFGANNRARVGGIIEDSTTGAEAIRLYSGNTASGAVERARVSSGGNLLIGTTGETGLTGAGGLKIDSTTAGSSGAGALVVMGGLATGAASYLGGAVTTSGSFNFNTATSQLWWATAAAANSRSWAFLNDAGLDGNFSLYRSLANTNSYLGAVVLNFDKAGAATFAGAVTVTGALKLGNAYVAGAVVGTGSITIQDSTGTTYRIPVLV